MKYFVKWMLLLTVLIMSFSFVLVPVAAAENDEQQDIIEIPLPPVEGEQSPFGVYVNGIPVTETNKKDVLGDVDEDVDTTFARVVFDDKTRELILSGNLVLSSATKMGDAEYGLLSVGKEDVSVRISEGSYVTFGHGVFLRHGDFDAKQATIFFGDNAGSTGSESFVRLQQGNLVMDGCRVECRSTEMISVVSDTVEEGVIPHGIGFIADYITLTNGTRLILTATAREIPLYAVLWADKNIDLVEKSTLLVEDGNSGYFADAFLHAGERARLSETHLNVRGVGCVFDVPTADLFIRDNSEILAGAVWGMIVGGDCVIEGESYIEISSSGGGIAVAGEDATFRSEGDTRLYLKKNETFTPPALARNYSWSGYVNAAFYSNGCAVTFKDVRFTAIDHDFGILCRSGGENLSFTGFFDIVADVAFFAAADSKADVSFGTEVKGDAVLFTIPATQLGELGEYAISFVPRDGVLGVRGGEITSLAEIRDAFYGFASECYIQVEIFPVAAVVVPCVMIVVVTLVIIILYKTGHIVIGRHRKNKEGTDTAAEESSAAENATTATTGEETQNADDSLSD